MYNSSLENRLISPDITNILQDYVSIQIDIDSTKIKSAALVAQEVDVKRVIKKANLDRCVDPQTPEDAALRELVIPAWCFFTYNRALKMHQGNLTDSGFMIEPEATDRNVAKSVATEHASIADAFMQDVIEFLEAEGADGASEMESKLSPKIRTFGGKECRSSN